MITTSQKYYYPHFKDDNIEVRVVKSCPGSYNKKVVEWESRLQNTLNHQAALTPSCLPKAGSLFFAVSFFLSLTGVLQFSL